MTSSVSSFRSSRDQGLGPAVATLVFAGIWLAPGVSLAEPGLHYELREQVTGVLIPSHRYATSGTCATGTGDAPASEYVRGGTGGGWGLGAGLGVRAFYENAPARLAGEPTWWGLRLGAGFDIDLLYAKVPTDSQGKLCALVSEAGADVRYQSSSVLLTRVPVLLGAELGVRTREDAQWHGIVLGWAWAPTLTILKPWVTDGHLDASYLGTELTMDFATARGVAEKEAAKRVAVFLLLPVADNSPAVLTLSYGAVWN